MSAPSSGLQPLPIDAHLGEVARALQQHGAVVLSAPPGSGKTTRIPRHLLDNVAGQIVVLEPRRLAARLAAKRVAEELGEPVGERIGFVTRFERAVSARTVVRFVTEGVLLRELLSDPELGHVSAVLIDEFHERHLTTDIALSRVGHLRETSRRDLRIVVMSATLDAEPVARFLGGAPIVEAPGRAFPVEITHQERPDTRPLEKQVAGAVRELLRASADGHVLVFLPGTAEIRKCQQQLRAIANEHSVEVVPLYGSLSPAEQDRAVRAGGPRRVVLATNVAETSVTIDGVVGVVDSGLARVATVDAKTGVSALKLQPIAQAAATQRAGRAGRTAPGRAIRLYTALDYDKRPAFEQPEIQRSDLAEPFLELVAAGFDPSAFHWFETPPAAAAQSAMALLERLSAITVNSGIPEISDDGKRMAQLPLPPRLARLLITAERAGSEALDQACALAAMLMEGAARRSHTFGGAADEARMVSTSSDVDVAIDDFTASMGPGGTAELRARSLDTLRMSSAHRTYRALRRALRTVGQGTDEPAVVFGRALCEAYPDRIGRLRRPKHETGRTGREVVFADGASARVSESSVVEHAEWVVVLDVLDREQAGRRSAVAHLVHAIEPDWIMDALGSQLVEEQTVVISDGAVGRAEVHETLSYGRLPLLSSTRPASSGEDGVADALYDHISRDLSLTRAIAPTEELEQLSLRLAVLTQLGESIPSATPTERLWSLVREACESAASIRELCDVDWTRLVEEELGRQTKGKLGSLAPESIQLPSGRRLRVTYYADGPPSVASRLQDFFGMRAGPTIGAGRLPLVLHLLAPNQRAVQVTSDLGGFWDRHYPQLSRELRRRYPKHAWPDDPRAASPPAPRGPRTKRR